MKKPTLKEMQTYIANKKGVYGGRRFERATDEVPNLAKMYQPESLIKHFAGDNAKAMMTMNPADFERYALKIPEDMSQGKLYSRSGAYDDDTKKNMSQADYLKHLAKVKGFADVPFLEISRQDPANLPKINAHEGRHRNRALASKGVDKALVQLLPNGDLRHLPRKYPEEFINALKENVGRDRYVSPQGGAQLSTDPTHKMYQWLKDNNLLDINRPQLPDFYAKGGKVSLLRKHGLPTSSIEDAQRKMGEGHLVFVAHEQDERPREVRSVSEFEGYAPDQIYTVHPQHFMQKKADGGNVQGNQMEQPLLSQYRMDVGRHANPDLMDNIGVEEAIDMHPKVFMNPNANKSGAPDVGGVSTAGGLPIGGVDQNAQQPGQQLTAPPPTQGGLPTQQPQQGQQPQAGEPIAPAPQMMPGGAPTGPTGGAPTGAAPNLLSMTPQGQKMQAMGSSSPLAPSNAPAGMAKGGAVEDQSTRITIPAEGFGGVKGITVPRHMWEGKTYGGTGPKQGKKVEGMRDLNEARAEVYGGEQRPPLTIGQVGSLHKKILNSHFGLPIHEQIANEEAALERLRKAKHIGANADTLDTSEKLDTVKHEHDEQGRTYEGFASKGVAGHSLYTSGHGNDSKHHAINTCPGATVGCSGGVDKNGIVDTSKGTCFAPNAEQQYVNAAVRRAAHEQAKHDPKMTEDWILAHTGSLRKVSNDLDKKNIRTLFRPNVVDETDVSSRHVIKGLNDQRKAEGKPIIVANSYGKTNELHDPENGYYVTHSNIGPKTKQGKSISENIDRDKQRVRSTITAQNASGKDFVNEQGNKTPPKGSYMVTNVRRDSPEDEAMQKHIKYAKYWSTGRPVQELSKEEKAEGDEAHYGADHEPTTKAKGHYGHRVHEGQRYEYQKQHILHPRLVNVPERKLNKETGETETVEHMIPTDSRFKDEDFLPKDRFVTRNGKQAGAILMTTPTKSTPIFQHHTSFTHHVGPEQIAHAKKNKGEYEIDAPEAQVAAAGKEYVPPEPIKIVRKAEGGSIHHHHLSEDHMAFPEQSFHAQEHNAHKIGIESIEDMPEHVIKKHYKSHITEYPAYKPPTTVDTMRIELMSKGKGK